MPKKALAEMRKERQVHPNMESVFRRTYSSPYSECYNQRKYLTSSMVIPIIEELCESLRSTRIHYTTIDAPRGVKILKDIIEGFDKRLATVLTSPSFVRATAVNLADIPRCVACDLFLVHLFVMLTLDCVYL